MNLRKVIATLVALIFIGLAVFLILRRGNDSAPNATPTTTTATTSTLSATTSTTAETTETTAGDNATTATTTTAAETTTTLASVQLSVPVVCTTDNASSSAVASVAEDAVTKLTPSSRVSTLGFGAIVFGMTVPTAAETSASSLLTCEPVSECYRVSPASSPPGVSLLVHSSTIERVDIVSGPVQTPSGLGIGTTEERLVEVLGSKLEEQAVDADTTNYVFVPTDSGDANFRVIFTVEDGAVTSYRAGRLPMILPDDPCA